MKLLDRRSLDWIDRAPVRVVAERRIDADADAVWAVIADHERWPEWFPALDEVVAGATHEGVGGTRSVSFGPMTVDEEFLAWEPARRFSFVVTGANRRVFKSLVEDVQLSERDGATTVTYTQAFDPVGGALVGKLLHGRFRKELAKGLDGLADRVTGASDRG